MMDMPKNTKVAVRGGRGGGDEQDGAVGGQRKEAVANEMGRGKRERATARLIERWPGAAGSFPVPVPACQHELACHIDESGKNERSAN